MSANYDMKYSSQSPCTETDEFLCPLCGLPMEEDERSFFCECGYDSTPEYEPDDDNS